jgi:murein DD-endopeptidase MepM/ murein hydrolase activator NlpD
VIGYMGSTGNSSGPHLHYELLNGSQRVNPHRYLPY